MIEKTKAINVSVS